MEYKNQESFGILKKKLASTHILALPDFTKHFFLETDASKDQLGAVLMQKEKVRSRVIGYYSRKLSTAEQNYSTTEKECLEVIWAVTTKCRPYLHGSKFTIITDHAALKWLLTLTNPNGRLARWNLKLLEYDFEEVTRPGRLHSLPDALSRLPTRDDVTISIQKLQPIEDRAGYTLPTREE